ncbi:isopentenyl-diphosphate delta-isomerase [Erwinia sp. OLTSP20]|uniref:isopentenyl-diphosphate Delta-isomerase n=1 Tax=unclassified Erwinia TaxID=2622719 RepID=UPI000C185001|nr:MULTISPECIES: isopentenyl-diphosphate Delta-isomerase [unclassified Erwinia]PIJ48700.1 isopentenyl-diphosphate delta-isomerase [Erwinia sp. OAMSP11]PIJ69323.1 isopentenyl-diphosphate delta-isomerase [Erwinia sp. OLSSP12]PIJ79157.1 isopentenyl-diphosphate delta-isomerase [Erwinia sp. OLCASP19]PIJ80683.1 isopentenyl-diphosphate delta-isomerase [Erwinia sp. OLMTSP26]PIJ82833.1 isopentenyl-diphosphate delta-isomerase [Erwinia sp. OLMDSP33]
MPEVEVILVDTADRPLGKMAKGEAHIRGLLHRAITIYVFNSQGELLLQRRAGDKYHCAGLWSNTTCGHPLPGEATPDAAKRRLAQEMGLALSLTPVFTLYYNLPVGSGMSEHEYGHVFFACSDTQPRLNPQEADAWRYAALPDIAQAMTHQPQQFTPWFLHTFPRIPQQAAAFLANRTAPV